VYFGIENYCRSLRSHGLRRGSAPLACWDCGFGFRRGHGCLSLVNIVCCQAEFFATDRSLVQSSPTECGVSNECNQVQPKHYTCYEWVEEARINKQKERKKERKNLK
jgi:hypothetical protein